MNRFRGNSGASQPITNAARPVLHFHEDDRPLDFPPANHVNQQVILLGSIHVQHALVYFIDRRFFRIDFYLDRVHQNLSGQLLDRLGHGRREKTVAPILRQPGDHLFDIRDETHVEHAVRLVQNECLDL